MQVETKAQAAGVFHLALKRDGKIIEKWDSPNLIVQEGRTLYQTSALTGGTPKTAWYLALFGNNRTPLDGDTGITIASLSGELTTEYDEVNRPAWVSNAAPTDVVSNSDNPGIFNINQTITIYGAFMVSENTKGGAVAGTMLMGESLFPASRDAQAGDQVIITYDITLSSS